MLQYFFLGWFAYWIGADKGEEVGSYYGFKDSDDIECENVEEDQAPRAGVGLSINSKYTFHKVSQIVFSQGFTSAKCIYFHKL